MVRLEMTEAGASKFWEAEQALRVLRIRWGRIGTAGQSQEKSFVDEAAAADALEKLVAEKTKKGYVRCEAAGTAAPPTTAPPAASPAAAQPASKPRRGGKGGLKTFSADTLRAFALAPDGSFLAYAGPQVKVGESYSQTLVVRRPDGEITFPVHGLVDSLAVLPDQRILVAVAEGWPKVPADAHLAQAGLVLFDAQGQELARRTGEAFLGAGRLAVDASGRAFALAATPPGVGHPRYLRTTVFYGLVEELASAAPRSVDLDRAFVDLALDGEGAVVIESHAAVLSFDLATGAARPFTGRVALRRAGQVKVLAAGEAIFDLPVNVCGLAALVDGGKRLLTCANAARKRLGKQAEAIVAWPAEEPLLRDDNLALWDVDARRLVRALPLGSGTLGQLAVAPGHLVATLAHGNKAKVEIIAWSALDAGGSHGT